MKFFKFYLVFTFLSPSLIAQIKDTTFLNPNKDREYAWSVVELERGIYFRSGAGSQLSGWVSDTKVDLSSYHISRNVNGYKSFLPFYVRSIDSTLVMYGTDKTDISRVHDLKANTPVYSFQTPVQDQAYTIALDTVDGFTRSFFVRYSANGDTSYLDVFNLDSSYMVGTLLNSNKFDFHSGGSILLEAMTYYSDEYNYGFVTSGHNGSGNELIVNLFRFNGQGTFLDTININFTNLGLPHSSWIYPSFRNIRFLLFKNHVVTGFYGRNHFHLLKFDFQGNVLGVNNLPYGLNSQKVVKGSTVVRDNRLMFKGLNNETIILGNWDLDFVDSQDTNRSIIVVLNEDLAVKWDQVIYENFTWPYSTMDEYDYVLLQQVRQLKDSTYLILGADHYDLHLGQADAGVDLRLIHLDRNGSYNHSLSVEQSQEIPEVQFYPNPSRGMIHYSVIQGNSDEFRVYSVSGKEVLRQLDPKTDGVIDISNLPSGVYTVRFIENERVVGQGKISVQ